MRKKLLSAFLTMCMILTMLPMSAFAADKTIVDLDKIDWTEGNTYKLTDDTQIKTVEITNEGTYKLDLDTYALYADSFDVAAGSSLEISAKSGSKTGVYAISKDIAFNLGGAAVTGKDVIFNDAVTVAASKARAVADASTFSGTFKKDLTIEGVKATLTDATLEGNLVIGQGAELTLGSGVKVDKNIEVAGKLIIGDGVTVELRGKLIMMEGGVVEAPNSNNKPYTFNVNGAGTVSVYALSKDTDGTDMYTLLADVTASSTVFLPKTGKMSLWFTNTVDTLKIDSNDVTSDIDKDSNTYLLDADTMSIDTASHTITVDFHRSSGGGGGSSGYSVNVASTTNGTVTVSPKNASKGAAVTVTAKPDKGYVLDTLTVTDKDGKKIDLTDKGDNKYTFVMPAGSVTVKATFKVAPKTPFTDVAENAWYADAVAYAYENGMVKGTSATKFSPEQTTTRGMIITILYRLEKEPTASASSFTDVPAGKYYSKAVAWAVANKVVTGYGDGKFGPDDTITREQLAAILYRYASYKSYDVTKAADLSKFNDASQVGAFAKAAMQWANAEGLINGISTTKLSPKSGATRAEVATILMRFCEDIAK